MRITALLLLIFGLFGFYGCAAKPYAMTGQPLNSATGSNEVYVVSHGWHTGIVVPANDIQTRLPLLKDRFGDVGHLEFGWGDKGFYQAGQITVGLTLRAVFWPTESVMHVVAVPMNPVDYFSDSQVKKLCISNDALSSLNRFIVSSFYRGSDSTGEGAVSVLKKGIYGNSQFYKGVGNFYLMNTCNKWTAKGLRSAGFNISPTFKLTADSVMGSLDELVCN